MSSVFVLEISNVVQHRLDVFLDSIRNGHFDRSYTMICRVNSFPKTCFWLCCRHPNVDGRFSCPETACIRATLIPDGCS